MAAQPTERTDPAQVVVVRVAVVAALVLQVVLALVSVLDPTSVDTPPLWIVLVGGFALTQQAVAAVLPWHRLLGTPRGTWLLRGHVALLVVAFGTAVEQGGRLDPGWVGLLAFLVAYAGLLLTGRDLTLATGCVLAIVLGRVVMDPAASLLPAITVLATITMIAAVGGLATRITARALARESSSRHHAEQTASALRLVTETARGIDASDPGHAVDVLLRAARDLGWDVAVIEVLRDDRMVLAGASGVTLDVDDAHLTEIRGMPRAVVETGQRVLRPRYDEWPDAAPSILAVGVRAAMGVPLDLGPHGVGVLATGRRAPDLPATLVDATDLLAGVSERALGSALSTAHQASTIRDLEADGQRTQAFVATLSHELRTPITVIAGLADTLIERWETAPDDMRHHLVTRLGANADAVQAVVGTLLDLARVQRDGIHAEHARFDLAAHVTAVVDRLGPMLDGHPTTLEVHGPLAVAGDVRLFDRTLENLLSNVARHTPKGTAVRVTAAAVDGLARVVVEDDGPGIDEATRRRIGQTLEADGSATRGLGIGLALVTEVLDLHGSRLHVDDDREVGTRIWFDLPLVADAADAPDPSAPTQRTREP